MAVADVGIIVLFWKWAGVDASCVVPVWWGLSQAATRMKRRSRASNSVGWKGLTM